MNQPTETAPLHIVVMVQRFLLPYAFIGRKPTEAECAKAIEGLVEAGVPDDELRFFAETVRDVFDEAAGLLTTVGNA